MEVYQIFSDYTTFVGINVPPFKTLVNKDQLQLTRKKLFLNFLFIFNLKKYHLMIKLHTLFKTYNLFLF